MVERPRFAPFWRGGVRAVNLAGKFQRDPSSGKWKRGSNGKLRRNTATMTKCCCIGGCTICSTAYLRFVVSGIVMPPTVVSGSVNGDFIIPIGQTSAFPCTFGAGVCGAIDYRPTNGLVYTGLQFVGGVGEGSFGLFQMAVTNGYLDASTGLASWCPGSTVPNPNGAIAQVRCFGLSPQSRSIPNCTDPIFFTPSGANLNGFTGGTIRAYLLSALP